MKILVKKATLIDPNAEHNGKKVDLLIEKGVITKIGKNIKDEKKWKIISSPELTVSPGWFDFRSHLCDPGFEYKEDLSSGMDAAAAGGFTGMGVLPNTHPVRDSKSGVEYALKHAQSHAVELIPYGAISEGLQGKNLAELYDMYKSGAKAFTDGDKAIKDANLMLRALLYAKGFDGLVMNLPDEATISLEGKINEGVMSTQLGLKGIPALAEELMVNRDLFLLSYSEGKLHIGPISSEQSLTLIREAKKKKLPVSTEVALANLMYTDEALHEFDSTFKVFPPLRTEKDRKALVKGLIKGEVDVISSNHHPENIENKDREFDHAAFGMTQLETFYPQFNMRLADELPLLRFVEAVALNPRQLLGLEIPTLAEGETANLTLFDPTLKWTHRKTEKKSKSENSPVLGHTLTGKVVGVINGTKSVWNE